MWLDLGALTTARAIESSDRMERTESLLTLCGLTSQKTHRGGLGLGGSVHEEAHPCFRYLVQPAYSSRLCHNKRKLT